MAVQTKNSKNQKMFRGVYTAIVTPFNKDESVDYATLKKLIEVQIASGVDGIVPCGTTGESPTLSTEEHEKVIEETIKIVDGRVKVIAGTGSNSTREAIEMSVHAEKVGADALLIVNPYYNKPTQEGLYRHFKAIANSVKIPLIVYNIKGRTGVNVETPTLMRIIKDCKNVVSVKEASGDINQMREVIKQVPPYFSVLSGDDGITLELIKSGGDGIISVAGNVIPKQMVEMVGYALNGNLKKAEEADKKLQPFFTMEFIETNPIPIKTMLAIQGKVKEVFRLPICEISKENKVKVEKLMKDMKLV